MTGEPSRMWIVVDDWERFQHRDAARSNVPTWIKDFTEQMSSDAYLSLTGHRRAILHGLRLEYARTRRRLPDDTASLSRRLALRVLRTDLKALNHAGFIHFSASKPAGNHASEHASLEVEKRREEVTKNPRSRPRTPEDRIAAMITNHAITQPVDLTAELAGYQLNGEAETRLRDLLTNTAGIAADQ